jgi:uncharacterized protein
MQTYLKFVERYAAFILAALAVVTVFFVTQLPKLSADSNPYFLHEDHPVRKSLLEMQKDFTGTFDSAMIAIHNEKGVFNRETADAVYHITEASRRIILTNDADRDQLIALGERYGAQSPEWKRTIEAIVKDGLSQNDFEDADKLPGLAKSLPLSFMERRFVEYFPRRINPVKELAGLAATENIALRDGVMVARPPLSDRSIDPATIRDEILTNELFIDGPVSKDGKTALVVVELYVKQEDAEGQLRAYETIKKIVDDYKAAHPKFATESEVHIAGIPIFIAEQKKLTDRDLGLLFPLVIAIVATILVLFFRRPMGVALPLINVVMASLWTLGLMAMNQAPIDIITSVLPVFLITICGADAIHMISEYYEQRSLVGDTREAMRRTMRIMVSPVLLTTVTTAAGFLISTSTNISGIQTFGFYMAIGLVFAQLISLLLVPAWICVFGNPRRKRVERAAEDKAAKHAWLGNLLAAAFRPVIRNRLAFGLVFAALIGGSGYMATKINVEDAGSSYFTADNPYRIADEFINRTVAGTSPGWIEIATNTPNGVLNLEHVRYIEKLENFVTSQPNVTYSYSLARYVRRINLVMNDMKPEYDRLPNDIETGTYVDETTGETVSEKIAGNDVVVQSVLMYENGGGSDLTNVLNSDFSKSVVLYTMNTTRATEYRILLDSLEEWVAQNPPPAGAQLKLAGTPVIWTGVLHEIVKGQFTSAIAALGAVALVLIIWLRSIRMGVLAALPLAATMVCYYGMMATFKIDLNIGTAIISFLIVGIVDYSVHFLHRIRVARSEHQLSLDDSIVHAIRYGGQSIAFNVMVFSLGFLTLLLSDFIPIRQLGGLVAISLTVSGLMSLFLISLLAPWFLPPERSAEAPLGDNSNATA